MATMKIFLSSTFQDLQEHRKRVIEAIDRLRHNGSDVEWLGMEAFGARDNLPSDVCLKFVDECDLYIGFFGVRYGSLDPKSNKSMTEIEYRRAVEQNKSRLIFLLSDDAPVKQRDFEPKFELQEKLKQLKEELKNNHVVDFFTTPEDLASKTSTSLNKFIDEQVRAITRSDYFNVHAQVSKNSHTQPLDCHICPDASLLDLELTQVEEFFKRELVQREDYFKSESSTQDKLLQFGFLQQSQISYGTLLCFGKNPQQFLVGATTRFIEWNGNTRHEGWRNEKECRGTIISQYTSVLTLIRKNLRLTRIIKQDGRSQRYEIPFIVLEEILANALVHRVYFNVTETIQVEIFDDRIEIKSPGGLPSPMTLDLLGLEDSSHPRNPLIARIFYLYGFVEKVGSGIARVQKTLMESGLSPAKFEQNEARTFKVTIQRPDQVTEELYEDVKLSVPPLPYFVHPYPLQAHFTGRVRERAMLSDWLTRGEHKTEATLSLCAIGGMGKSALAWYWLTQDVLSLGFDSWALAGAFWWSFYEERDFGSFLSRAIEYVSGGKIDPKSLASDRDRVETLINLLRASRFLFVLDGFERVLRAYARMDAAYRGDEVDEREQNYRACVDPNAGAFLKMLASGAMLTKTLVTTRLHPRELDDLDGACHEDLTGMDAEDAVAFFQAQGIKGTWAQITQACEPYGYHPLSLRLLAGALKQDPRYHADINNAPRVDVSNADRDKRMTRMLEFAYNSLPPHEQNLLSQLSAFRSPMKYETIQEIFTAERAKSAEKKENNNSSAISAPASRVIASEAKQSPTSELEIASSQKPLLAMTWTTRDLARAISDLAERGLYMRDAQTDTFDLHPVIRRYCYERLADKSQTHAIFIIYFEKVEKPKKIETLADLLPTIELYHHTVRAGRYDEARILYSARLSKPLYFQLGDYKTQIELLRALFPEGEDKPPRLKDASAQAWTLNTLALSYSLVGQPRRAVTLFLQASGLWEKANDKKNLATGFGNVAAHGHLSIGELKAAEENLRRSLEICREIKDESAEGFDHIELGHMLIYEGRFKEAKDEFDVAFKINRDNQQAQSVIMAYRALCALLMGDASAALAAARKARGFAEEYVRTDYPVERDFIRAEWMIGAALVASANVGANPRGRPTQGEDKPSPLQDAERHLQEALMRDRKIGLVEVEAAILLQFAKLRKAAASQQSLVDSKKCDELMRESFDFANEALQIAERCEYRLDEAEIQNFLAEWYFEQGSKGAEEQGRRESLNKARDHAVRAKERAWCDGPPYYYKVAYEQAEKMLKQIEEFQL